MSNGLLYIAGLISLALAALFGVPYFVDWNGYRGVFEEEATRILGREVRVGGDVNVRFLPSPYVSFEKLRIADPTGSTGEPFFRADSFTMRLSAPPLLKGIIEANEIVLEKPVLRLAVDAEGSGNWRGFSIAPGALPFVPAGVSLQSVKIVDGVIAFHGPKGIGFAELDGLNGELKAESIDGPFAFKGLTKFQGTDRDVRISTGATEADGGIRFKAIVRDTSGSANVYSVDGRLDDLKNRPRVAGEVTAKLALPAGELPIATAPTSPTGARRQGRSAADEFQGTRRRRREGAAPRRYRARLRARGAAAAHQWLGIGNVDRGTERRDGALLALARSRPCGQIRRGVRQPVQHGA